MTGVLYFKEKDGRETNGFTEFWQTRMLLVICQNKRFLIHESKSAKMKLIEQIQVKMMSFIDGPRNENTQLLQQCKRDYIGEVIKYEKHRDTKDKQKGLICWLACFLFCFVILF